MSLSPAVPEKAMPGQKRQSTWISPKSPTFVEKKPHNLLAAGTGQQHLSEQKDKECI